MDFGYYIVHSDCSHRSTKCGQALEDGERGYLGGKVKMA